MLKISDNLSCLQKAGQSWEKMLLLSSTLISRLLIRQRNQKGKIGLYQEKLREQRVKRRKNLYQEV